MSFVYELIGRIVVTFVRIRYRRQLRIAAVVIVAAAGAAAARGLSPSGAPEA